MPNLMPAPKSKDSEPSKVDANEEVLAMSGPSLVARLCAIMGTLIPVEKNGKNQAQNYQYVKADDVTKMLQHKLAAAGILIVPNTGALSRTVMPTKSGQQTVTVADMLFSIHDAFSSQVISATWAGEGADSGDKGLPKAQTGALKTFLSKLFLMGTGEADDPEYDGGPEDKPKRAKVDTTQTPAADRDRKVPPSPQEAAPKKTPGTRSGSEYLGQIKEGIDQLGLTGNRPAIQALLAEMLATIPEGCPITSDGMPTLQGASVVQLQHVACYLAHKSGQDIPF